MIIGLMSDIHGNATALRAVIEDAGDVDAWWVLGDLVALGPDPVGTLETIHGLPNVEAIGGNTERYVLVGDLPYPHADDVRADNSLLERFAEVAASFAWTRGMVTATGWFEWLAQLPSELRRTLPDGTRALGIHASPGSDDGQGIDTRISDTDLTDLLDGCHADLVIGGHTHDMTDRRIGDVRAVNLGSVSNSHRPDGRATYALLHVDDDTHRVEQRSVEYDHATEIHALDRLHHPAGDYIRRFHAPHDS